MTWLEFYTAVYDLLPSDAKRLNVGVSSTTDEPWLRRLIRHAVGDLQRYVPAYTVGHESIFTPDDLTIEGKAQWGNIPSTEMSAAIRMLYSVKAGHTCCRRPYQSYVGGWAHRFDLVCGNVMSANQGQVVIDPYGKQFLILPRIETGWELDVWWDGIKINFLDAETVPFDEQAANAVALYCKAHIEREVKQSSDGFLSFMGKPGTPEVGTYYYERQQLFLSHNRTTKLVEVARAQQQTSTCSACACADTTPETVEFVGFGDSGDMTEDECYEYSSYVYNDDDEIAHVIQIVRPLEPGVILHLGDTAYPDMEDGRFVHQFLQYFEDYRAAEDLFVARGNHDSADLFTFLSYIQALNSGEYFYSFVRGPVEFFVLDSEGDPISQNTWLQAAVAASTAIWKIAALHKAPYTSDLLHATGDTTWRLDFSAFDAVLSGHGHQYERIVVDDVLYLVVGTGGQTLRELTNPRVTGSMFGYAEKNGILHGTADETVLNMRFINTDNEEIDKVVLRK